MKCHTKFIKRRGENYLGIQEGSKDSDGRSESIDRLDRCVENDNGGDYDRYTLHGISNAKGQGRDLI